jgi:hypothetical protein
VPGICELELIQQFTGSPVRGGAAEAGEGGHHAQVLIAGLQLVDRRVLAGEADAAAHPAPLPEDVEAGDRGRARVGSDQCGQDLHHCRLAGPVRTEQREHATRIDVKIHAVEDADTSVGRHEPGRPDRQLIGHQCSPLRTAYLVRSTP